MKHRSIEHLITFDTTFNTINSLIMNLCIDYSLAAPFDSRNKSYLVRNRVSSGMT
jgi:hypothetical protein